MISLLINFRTIVEACLWNSPSDALAKKRVICKAITLHLLNYHYGISSSEISYVADEFDVAYQLESTHFLFEDKEDNAENLAFAVIKSFDEVAKNLRALDNIPLDISSVLGWYLKKNGSKIQGHRIILNLYI